MPRGGQQPLGNFESALGLPPGFCARSGGIAGATYAEAVDWLESERPAQQNHWPALTLALVALAERVLAALPAESLDDGLDDKRIAVELAAPGERRAVNTLNVRAEIGSRETVRLRPLYNRALEVIHTEMRRSHPSNPGHATQSWPQYRTLIDTILAMRPEERTALAAWTWQHGVLAKSELTRSQHRTRQPRPFSEVAEGLQTQSRHGGVLFQALVYAYVVADSPTLRVESNAVNTGSSRAGAVGDVDGFDGEFVVLAVEAKDKDLTAADEDDLTAFIDDADSIPDADAAVFARTFDDGIRSILAKHGIRAVSRHDMSATVALWDPTKQTVAIKAMRYFLARVQRKPELLAVIDDFLATVT